MDEPFASYDHPGRCSVHQADRNTPIVGRVLSLQCVGGCLLELTVLRAVSAVGPGALQSGELLTTLIRTFPSGFTVRDEMQQPSDVGMASLGKRMRRQLVPVRYRYRCWHQRERSCSWL